MMRRSGCLLLLLALATQAGAAAPPLVLLRTIGLPDVHGRIDHLAIDPGRHRLIVAEPGNGSVDVIDLSRGRVVHRILGQREPQGVAYAARGDAILVANGGDGRVRIFAGSGFAPSGTVPLGADADNLHIDPRNGLAVAGYGGGGLAIIDPASGLPVARIGLPAHPEGFAIDPRTGRAFINIPDAKEIAVADLDAHRLVAAWPIGTGGGNFPIAIDTRHGLLASGFRSPPELGLFDLKEGTLRRRLALCTDADDLFVDQRRERIYAICGSGEIQVWAHAPTGWAGLPAVRTAPGARTGLFVPALDLLFVAVREAEPGREAAIRIYRPVP